jgi:hypothetical protein
MNNLWSRVATNIARRNFFVIGPEKQMSAYEAYLKSVEGADTQLYRLYPRDFWLTPKQSAPQVLGVLKSSGCRFVINAA